MTGCVNEPRAAVLRLGHQERRSLREATKTASSRLQEVGPQTWFSNPHLEFTQMHVGDSRLTWRKVLSAGPSDQMMFGDYRLREDWFSSWKTTTSRQQLHREGQEHEAEGSGEAEWFTSSLSSFNVQELASMSSHHVSVHQGPDGADVPQSLVEGQQL